MANSVFTPHVIFGLDPMAVSTAILLVAYGAIIWDKLNRSIVAGLALARCANQIAAYCKGAGDRCSLPHGFFPLGHGLFSH